jgi:GWxTD domain-containing protein
MPDINNSTAPVADVFFVSLLRFSTFVYFSSSSFSLRSFLRALVLACAAFVCVCAPPQLVGQINRTLNLPPQQQPSRGASSQTETSGQNFYMDVLLFNGEGDSTQRVDVFVVIPYQSINFVKRGDSVFVADYIVRITLKDQAGREVKTIRKERPIKENRLDVTLGATGGFDYTQTTLNVTPGSYTIVAEISDILSKRAFSLQRSFTALSMNERQFGMSSIMLASGITPKGERFVITPYLNDDVSALTQEGFYAFFETYNSFGEGLDSLDFMYEVLDERNLKATTSKRIRRSVREVRAQHAIKVNLPASLPLGSYTLRVVALRPDDTSSKYAERALIAASARTISIQWKGLGMLTMLKGEELNRAIRQMRYVASPQDISMLLAIASEEERQQRFFDYWQRLDPTPATLRNEAFEDYYQRVDYANRNFRSSSFGEGWMSDLGMVYIIYGPPQFTRDFRRDGRIIWTWSYPTYGREFVFVDYTGFGNDFRLSSGAPFDRYRYRR